MARRHVHIASVSAADAGNHFAPRQEINQQDVTLTQPVTDIQSAKRDLSYSPHQPPSLQQLLPASATFKRRLRTAFFQRTFYRFLYSCCIAYPFLQKNRFHLFFTFLVFFSISDFCFLSSKCTEMLLVAWICSHPLAEFRALPIPLWMD